MTIHWVGTGLSSAPGLRRLLDAGQPVVVWNRTPEKARQALAGRPAEVRPYTLDALTAAVDAGDIVVSMLPADRHVALTRLCISAAAHFVSSSYVSPAMEDLDDVARGAGVALVNEVGLDPGIDHLMAHDLVADYRRLARPGDRVAFTSYCGGIPRHLNPLRYKFSWSPLGVLRALRASSTSVRDGRRLEAARPWDVVTTFEAPLPVAERFEVYPNRDSLPFIARYGFQPDWELRDFVRGTIRPEGWKAAWAPVFRELEALSGGPGEAGMAALADRLWHDNAYAPGEPDRVVLCVGLRAERDGTAVFHQEAVLDAEGDADGTAMARLVSVPVALAVEALAAGRIGPGVHAGPDDPRLGAEWLAEIAGLAGYMARVDHLAGVPD